MSPWARIVRETEREQQTERERQRERARAREGERQRERERKKERERDSNNLQGHSELGGQGNGSVTPIGLCVVHHDQLIPGRVRVHVRVRA